MPWRWGHISSRLLLILVAGTLIGCVNRYSGRALTYNLEAEQAQQRMLFLNVIRASLRRPMQFTTVTDVTSTDISHATSALTVPFGPYVSGNANSLVIEPPDYSEQAEVKVSVLDTKEFYYGLLSPVPGQMFDLYIQSGFPRDALFNLFLRKIVVHRADCDEGSHYKGCEFTFVNYPGRDRDLDLFQRLVNYLLRLGLTTEPIEEADDNAGGSKKAKTKKKKKKDEDEDSGDDDVVQFRFCFAPRDYKYLKYNYVPRESRCGVTDTAGKMMARRAAKPSGNKAGRVPHEPPPATPVPISVPSTSATLPGTPPNSKSMVGKKTTVIPRIYIPREVINDMIAMARRDQQSDDDLSPETDLGMELDQFANAWISLTFYTRSVENLLYYLGEVTRRQLYPDPVHGRPSSPRIIQIKALPPHIDFPEPVCDNRILQPPELHCTDLFVVDQEVGPPSAKWAYSAEYDGRRYFLRDAPNLAIGGGPGENLGYSTQVLDVTKQLFAVNISADKLPRTATITSVTPRR